MEGWIWKNMEYVSAEIWEKIPEDIKKMINFQRISC